MPWCKFNWNWKINSGIANAYINVLKKIPLWVQKNPQGILIYVCVPKFTCAIPNFYAIIFNEQYVDWIDA